MIDVQSPTQPSSTTGTMKPIHVIDLFCGAGGLTFGLKNAGLKVKIGVDLDPACKFAFEANSDAQFECRDIKDVTSDDINSWIGNDGINVLAGCAPCQPFSTYSNTRKSKDERWSLLTEFQRLALEVLPTIVTMENVPGLARQTIWAEFVQALKENGYFVNWSIVNCADFGIPQTRRRLVFLASRLDFIVLDNPPIKKLNTVRDAIGDLPPIKAGEVSKDNPFHAAARLSNTNIKRIKASKPGGTWRDWPKNLRAQCHQKNSGKTYPSVYGRMEWDKPSPTLTTQCYGFGNGRFGHPEQDRAISLREAALLQSFPIDYQFIKPNTKINLSKMGMLIGNAVPPKLAEYIGHLIYQHIRDHIAGVK